MTDDDEIKHDTTTTEVTAWRCGQCRRMHDEKATADACCTCGKCGVKMHKSGGPSSAFCLECGRGNKMREARKSIEVYERKIEILRATLARYEAEKKAEKKR